MKLTHVLRNTVGLVFAVVLLASAPLATAQDAEEYGEGVSYSPTQVIGAPATSVQQVFSSTQPFTTTQFADPTKGIAAPK